MQQDSDPMAITAEELVAELQTLRPELVELAANRVANRHLAGRVADLEAQLLEREAGPGDDGLADVGPGQPS